MQKIKKVIQLSSSISSGCRYCSGVELNDSFDSKINHYLQKHNFVLIHVGQETTTDFEGKSWQNTVAVLGSEKLLKEKPVPKLVVKIRKS